jgi:hypothetical protein
MAAATGRSLTIESDSQGTIVTATVPLTLSAAAPLVPKFSARMKAAACTHSLRCADLQNRVRRLASPVGEIARPVQIRLIPQQRLISM